MTDYQPVTMLNVNRDSRGVRLYIILEGLKARPIVTESMDARKALALAEQLIHAARTVLGRGGDGR